jgi:nucleotide-binding universal stress UspA family protein
MEVGMPELPVVVGTDGSQEAMQAVEWAAKEAGRRRVPLRIVSIPELWPYSEPLGKLADAATAEAAVSAEVTHAEQAVSAAARRAAELVPGLSVERSSPASAPDSGPASAPDSGPASAPVGPASASDGPAGSPAGQLLAAAAQAQLLVVGCRGSGGFSGLALGSTSRHLATHAQAPVVVVREETVPPSAEIVVGVRTPHQAAAALHFAFSEASLRGASLRVLEAVPPGRLAAIADVNGDVLTATRNVLDAHLDRWRREFPGVQTQVDIVRAHPGRVLSAASARADLVVLGRHGTHSGSLGAVIHAVLAHAQGPVAVVPGD